MNPVNTLSWRFGCLIGAMWMGLMLLGNLGGTSVFGHLRELHPGIYALNRLFWTGALGSILFAGIIASYRIGSIREALKVGIFAGLISGAIVFATLLGMTFLFHNAMMLDPSNIHEFALSAHRAPTQAELSTFIYTDALGGALKRRVEYDVDLPAPRHRAGRTRRRCRKVDAPVGYCSAARYFCLASSEYCACGRFSLNVTVCSG